MKPIYIELNAQVRYWEDGYINGKSDDDGSLVPFKNGDRWCPLIRLEDGVVLDWPSGTFADIHYKVCDAGEYWLLDENKKRIGVWGGYYVPDDFLCPSEQGYGDYIILKIDMNGVIEDWKHPTVEWACTCDDNESDDQTNWKSVK